jgi:hypothetical protein
MTRGWNLEASGEYLPILEQLDSVSAKPEKARTLEAVLVTEFAHQPVRALLILPFIKIAKFFAIGYASTAEAGLSDGGYARATLIYQSLRSLYAPLILLPCAVGLLICWESRRLQLRLMTPVLLMVMSCAAIVLIWETSPRYSHPVQFAMLMLATVGISRISRRPLSLVLPARALLEVVSGSAAIVFCWLLLSACIFGAARSLTHEQLLDPRMMSLKIDDKPARVEPLHSFSASWEGDIALPQGTALPATVRVSFPEPPTGSWNHLSVSLWLPDAPSGSDKGYQVSYRHDGVSESVPSAESGHISRVEIPKAGDRPGTLILSVGSAMGKTWTAEPFRIGIGYALAN